MTLPPFRSQEEELQQLARDIAEAKVTLRGLATTLSKLERHVARAFNVYTPQSPKKGKRLSGPTISSLSPDKALGLFDDLVAKARSSSDRSAVHQQLEDLTTADLSLLATELGLARGKRPNRTHLIEQVMGRLQEAVMLGRNLNVTASRSEDRSGAT